MWWVAVFSFVGALVGAGIPAAVAVRGQRQSARSEWRQRFDRAIDLATGDNPEQRHIGDELVAELMESDLGSEADRDLAKRVGKIRVQAEGTSVDAGAGVSDNGEHDQEEEARS